MVWRPALPSLALVGLFALLLVPRLLFPDRFMTADEDNWLIRGAAFRLALEAGTWGETYQNGHPGVLTMELVAATLDDQQARQVVDGARASQQRYHVNTGFTGFMELLARARLAVGLATALLVVALAGLAALHLGWWPGLLAALLVGWDPFLLALSRAVHVDALMSLLATVAVLAGLGFWLRRGGWWLLALSASAAGLAALSKSPALVLVALMPLLAAWCWSRQSPRPAPGWLLGSLAAWAALFALTWLIAWPAMWGDPLGTTARVLSFASDEGGQTEAGSFFLGAAVDDPGPLFYPVALALRATPALCLGLLAAGWLAARRRGWAAEQRAPLLPLLAWALAFVLVMTLAPKKMDRYVVAVVPALYLVAVAGALGLARGRRGWTAAAVALLLGSQLVGLAASQPYFSTYYNPLLGGGRTAALAIPVGWGEGLDQVAAYLNSRPDPRHLRVVALEFDGLRAQYVGNGEPLRDRLPDARTDYLVLTLSGVQKRKHAEAYEPLIAGRPPEFTARIGGVDYAWAYRLRPDQ